MKVHEDQELKQALEGLNLRFNSQRGTYLLQGRDQFFYDLYTHQFTLECDNPEHCFPVQNSDNSQLEHLPMVYREQLQQILMKEVSNKAVLVQNYNILSELRPDVSLLWQQSLFSDQQKKLFEHYRKRYMYFYMILLKGYSRKVEILEASLVQMESILAHMQEENQSLDETGANSTKMGLFLMLHETLNALKHPIMINHKHLYDVSPDWSEVLTNWVNHSSQESRNSYPRTSNFL